MSLDFYQTVGGRQFIDGTMKDIAHSLKRIADVLEEQNNKESVCCVFCSKEKDREELWDECNKNKDE